MWVKHKKYDEFSLAQFFLVITMLLDTLSYIANLIHLIVYSYNGFGIPTMYVISLILQVNIYYYIRFVLNLV